MRTTWSSNPGEWYVANSYSQRVIVHRRAVDGPMAAHSFKVRYVLPDATDYSSLWEFPPLCTGAEARQLDEIWRKGQRPWPHRSPWFQSPPSASPFSCLPSSAAWNMRKTAPGASLPLGDCCRITRHIDAHLTARLSPAKQCVLCRTYWLSYVLLPSWSASARSMSIPISIMPPRLRHKPSVPAACWWKPGFPWAVRPFFCGV